MLKNCGYSSDCLNDILTDDYGKLFIDQKIDFNISHSGNFVICAVSNTGRLGIDIEQTKPIDVSDFNCFLAPEPIEEYGKSTDSYKKFYGYGILIESVLKADG